MTTYENLLTRNYAQAYLNIHKKNIDNVTNSVLENDLAGFKDIISLFKEKPELTHYLSLPCIIPSERIALIEQVTKRIHLSDLAKKLIFVLIQRGHACLINQTLATALTLHQKHTNLFICTITSAHPLSSDDIQVIVKFLEYTTKKKISYNLVVDARLIAGIRIMSETLLWEFSIDKQLRTIQSCVHSEKFILKKITKDTHGT